MNLRIVLIPLICVLASPCVAESRHSPIVKYSENLRSTPKIITPTGSRIVETLKKFEGAFEAGNKNEIASLVATDFQFLRMHNGKIAEAVNEENFLHIIGAELRFSLSHINTAKNSDLIYAAAVLEREGKYFNNQNFTIFVFEKTNLGKIKTIISSPIYYKVYPSDGVSVYFADSYDANKIKMALNSKNVDKAMDDLVKGSLDRFTARQEFSTLVVFRTPPKPTSKIETEIILRSANGRSSNTFKFKHKQSGFGRYAALSDHIQTHKNAGSVTVKVYVDDALVGSKTINN